MEGGSGGGVPPYFLHREGGVHKGLMLFMNGPLHSLPRGKGTGVFLSTSDNTRQNNRLISCPHTNDILI